MTQSPRRLEWTWHARKDVTEILGYTLAMWGAEQVDRYAAEMYSALTLVQQFPESGAPRPDLFEGARIVPFGKHIIVYQVDPDTISIARIVHGRMDLRRIFRRQRS